MRSAVVAVGCLLGLFNVAVAAPATAPAGGRVSFLGVEDRAARIAIVVNADVASGPDGALWDEVQKTVEGLGADQSFNILWVVFEAFAAIDRDELLPATAANRRRAYGFIEERIRPRPSTGVVRSLSASLLREAAARTKPGVRRGLMEAAVEKLDRPPRFEMDALPRPLRKPAGKLRQRFLAGLDFGGHRPDFAVQRAMEMGAKVIYLFDDCTGDDDRMAGMELYEACRRLNTRGTVRFHVVALVRPEDLQEPLPADALAEIVAQLKGGTFTIVTRSSTGEFRRQGERNR